MSKRRNRKASQPNIPEDTLRRARQEAGLEPVDAEDEAAEAEPEAPPAPVPAPVIARPDPPPAAAPPRASSTRRQSAAREAAGSTPARRRRRTDKVNFEELTHEEVMELLDNPTRTVTEAELHAQYGYVLADLRSMFMLAAALFIVMIVAAVIFV